jgi:hypothetical protein
VLIEPSLDDPCMALCVIDRAPKPLLMESYPKFHNEVGPIKARTSFSSTNRCMGSLGDAMKSKRS